MKLPRPSLLLARTVGAAAVLLIVGGLTGTTFPVEAGWALLWIAALFALFLGLRKVLRTLLWSVGRRLLVSYLLLGLVPIPLLMGIGIAVVYSASGQMAGRRVATELDSVIRQMEGLGDQAERAWDAPPSAEELALLLAEQKRPLPGVGLAFRAGDGAAFGAGSLDPAEILPTAGPFDDDSGLGVLADGRHFLFTWRNVAGGSLLVYLPVEPHLRQLLSERARISVDFPYSTTPPERRITGLHLTLDSEIKVQEQAENETLSTHRTLVLDKPPGSDEDGFGSSVPLFWARFVELPYLDWGRLSPADGEAPADLRRALIEKRPFPFIVRSTIPRERYALFDVGGAEDAEDADAEIGNAPLAREVVRSIRVLGFALAVIYLSAAMLAAFLVFRVARAARRLHVGIEAVEEGRFDHRIRFAGNDQLAALTDGFNEMVDHLEAAVAERAERRAIDRELQVARDLQESLLPAADVVLPGLETAVDFQPAAAIGGDFYHFADHGDGRVAVVIADVSGHGLGTGIVMASAQSLLAALTQDGIPTADLLSRLDRQLRHMTDRRTFVTLAHCLFELGRGRVTVSSAGHLYPYRVPPDGPVEAVGSPCRPLGTPLVGPLPVVGVEATCEPGDLWVLVSDGVVEASDADGNIFGFDRFEALLAHCAGRSAEAARALLVEAFRRFAGSRSPDDDRTLIVLRALDPEEASGDGAEL